MNFFAGERQRRPGLLAQIGRREAAGAATFVRCRIRKVVNIRDVCAPPIRPDLARHPRFRRRNLALSRFDRAFVTFCLPIGHSRCHSPTQAGLIGILPLRSG